MEKDFYQISLKLLLKNAKGEMLALKAVQGGSYSGFYDLPGGRIEIDEFNTGFADILAREVAEEIGNIKYRLRLKPVAIGRHQMAGTWTKEEKDKHVLYVFFEAEYEGGELKISHEHAGYEWLNLKEIQLEKYFISGILEGILMYLK